MRAMLLANDLRDATRSMSLDQERFAVMKGRFQELERGWSGLESRLESKGHFRGTAFHNVWQCVSMEMTHCAQCVQEALQIDQTLDRQGMSSANDLALLSQFVKVLAKMESNITLCEREVQDVQVLAEVDGAADAALRSCSMGAMARSLAAAVCRSIEPTHATVAVFLRTAFDSATCLSAAHEGEASVYADMYANIPERATRSNGGGGKKEAIRVGFTSTTGDAYGYDSLMKGAMHHKRFYAQPLVLPEHHRSHGHGAGHDDPPVVYVYISKQPNGDTSSSGKSSSGTSSSSSDTVAFPARVNRFVATLGELTASRTAALEQLDRLVRVARSGIDLMTCLLHPELQCFVALRIKQTGLRFILGSGTHFSTLPSEVSFMKARNCRTIMAAGESEHPRSGDLLGECLAWRCGPVVNAAGFGDLSIVVGVSGISDPGAGLFRSVHQTMLRAARAAMKETVGEPLQGKSFRSESLQDQRQHFTMLPLRMFWFDHVIGGGGGGGGDVNGVKGRIFAQELAAAVASGRPQSRLMRDVRKFLGNGDRNYRVDFSRLDPKEFQTRLAECDPSRRGASRSGAEEGGGGGGGLRAGGYDPTDDALAAAPAGGLGVLHRWLAVARLVNRAAKVPTDVGLRRESLVVGAAAPSPSRSRERKRQQIDTAVVPEEEAEPATARQEPGVRGGSGGVALSPGKGNSLKAR